MYRSDTTKSVRWTDERNADSTLIACLNELLSRGTFSWKGENRQSEGFCARHVKCNISVNDMQRWSSHASMFKARKGSTLFYHRQFRTSQIRRIYRLGEIRLGFTKMTSSDVVTY